MINVLFNEDRYQYDVYALIKAFYPEEDIKVNISEVMTNDAPDEGALFCCINYSDEEISMKCKAAEDGRESAHSLNVNDYDAGDIKNAFKRSIYDCLKELTGKSLPWGILTGIRPTKLMMGMINEGKSDEEINKIMSETYYVSDEKSVLGTNIAKLEMSLIDGADLEECFSLYVGIPFCPTTCMYCSFTSYPIASWKNKVDEYIDTLEKEIDATSEMFSNKTLVSVYIGGGTPTTLDEEQFIRLFECLRRNYDFSTVKEITVECGRPDSITEGKLRTLKELGVTRISVNPQTMNDETLKLIGRLHSVEQVREAYKLARECGFDNINMDLILGLPGETDVHVKTTMEEILKLDPDSVTVHSLAMKRAAKMHSFLEEHPEYDSVISDEMLATVYEYADKMDMKPYYLYRQKNMTGNYENVGYAKEGKFGLYNILIMEEVQTIIACGAGTVTKRVYPDGRIERCDNVKDVALYISKIEEMIDRKRQLFAD